MTAEQLWHESLWVFFIEINTSGGLSALFLSPELIFEITTCSLCFFVENDWYANDSIISYPTRRSPATRSKLVLIFGIDGHRSLTETRREITPSNAVPQKKYLQYFMNRCSWIQTESFKIIHTLKCTLIPIFKVLLSGGPSLKFTKIFANVCTAFSCQKDMENRTCVAFNSTFIKPLRKNSRLMWLGFK